MLRTWRRGCPPAGSGAKSPGGSPWKNASRGFELTTAQPAGQPQGGARETRTKTTGVFLPLLQNVVQRGTALRVANHGTQRGGREGGREAEARPTAAVVAGAGGAPPGERPRGLGRDGAGRVSRERPQRQAG